MLNIVKVIKNKNAKQIFGKGIQKILLKLANMC